MKFNIPILAFTTAALLACNQVEPSARIAPTTGMCRNERWTPPVPSGTISDVSIWNATYARGSTPQEREAKRDDLFEINGSSADLPFRLFVMDKSQPLQVLYKVGLNFQNGPVIRPGTVIDIKQPRFYLRNYCSSGSSCATSDLLEFRCRVGGRWRTEYYYFNAGTAMLLEGRDAYRRRDVTWQNHSSYFMTWDNSPKVTVVDSAKPLTYFVWGAARGNVIVDGEDTGPLQPRPGRYYEGRQIEVRLNNPGTRTSFNFRFIREEAIRLAGGANN